LTTTEPSSFRDQSSRLFVAESRFLRGFDERSAETFLAAEASGVVAALVGRGKLVAYTTVDPSSVPEIQPSALVICPETLPFVSTPPEWSFSMLKDAALLTLDINAELLDHGFILKDATAYNVTFKGAQPIFLDHGSVERIGEQGIWSAYGQFVDHFVSPLFLEAYAGVAFQPRLRGTVEGIPVAEMNALLRGSSRRRKGVLTHVALRSRLERSASGYGAERRTEVAATQLPRQAVKATIVKLRKLIARLESPVVGEWTDYEDAVPYADDEHEQKRVFVERAARSVGGGVLIDVGANTGSFSRAASGLFDTVLAMDIDPSAVDILYRRLASEGNTSITPLVVDLLNPTPATGWRNSERASIFDRATGDLGLWLAVLHHLTITGGIPLPLSLDLAAMLTRYALIEFVLPTDPMVELIGTSRSSEAAPYDLATFQAEIEKRFEVIEELYPKPTRLLVFAKSLAWDEASARA